MQGTGISNSSPEVDNTLSEFEKEAQNSSMNILATAYFRQ